MVQAVSYVHQALISRGSGYLDFGQELKEIRPDIFVVNEDGNTPDKRKLCESLGIDYVVLNREPRVGLQPRSTTSLRAAHRMPYRIDLAGGWLDQPWVSQVYPGSVVVAALWPTVDFEDGSGMANSSRTVARKIYQQLESES